MWGGKRFKHPGFPKGQGPHLTFLDAATPDYQAGPRFDGEGAAAFIYEQQFTLPTILFRGRARVAGEMRVHQHPQIYYTLAVPVAGIGGLVAGQIFGQPLVSNAPIESAPM
jgi:hypothetical protein